MKYRIIEDVTNESCGDFFSLEEAKETMEYEFSYQTHSIIQVIECRGCGTEDNVSHRSDAHGISTGHWCEDCYNSSAYPYRKDRYPTLEHDGFGERLSDEY